MTPVALLVAAVAVLGATGTAPVPAADVDASPVEVLARERVGGHDAVATAAGDVVAVWERATDRRARVVAAVRPAGGGWREPHVLTAWRAAGVDGRVGDPQLALGADGTVLAVWVDARHRVVRSTWRAGAGWSSPRRLSGRGEVAQGPRAASNDLGQVVVTWQQRAHDRVLVRSAVRRGPGWFVSTVGPQGPRGLGADPAAVGIDDAGNVTVAWYRLRPKPPHSSDGLERAQDRSLAARLPADATSWETPHAFGDWEPFFDDERASLVVEGDGTAWVADWAGAWDAPQPGPMWTRSGGGAWQADDRAPYAVNFVTEGSELVSWADSDAHAADAVHTRQPDGSWTTADLRAGAVVLDRAGHAAAIGVRQETLLVWLRDDAGAWGPEQVLVRNLTRQNDRGDELVVSATIAPDGTVTVLWRTYADEYPGDHPEHGPDLRSVQFAAVAPPVP